MNSNDPLERIKATAAKFAQTKKAQEEREAASATDVPEPIVIKTPRLPRRSGSSARQVAQRANESLEQFARQHGIEQFDLFPGGEYPTLLTRLPLFPPIQRERARSIAAEKTKAADWIPLESRWDGGGVWKTGPALTVYDEDTLAGLMKLRSHGFCGPSDRLPLPTARSGPGLTTGNSTTKVHALFCLVSQLETVIQCKEQPKGWGGRAIKKRRESIERLGAIKLKFERTKNHDEYRGTQIDLLHIDWVGDRRDACYYVQFHPLVSAWLEDYRTFMDLYLRRELSPLGKCIYRFLASQRSNRRYSEELEVIAEAIGVDAPLREMKRQLKVPLETLVSHEFLSSAEITGTGRKTPYRLVVEFKFK